MRGTCPVPSHTPRNEFDVTNEVRKDTRVLSRIGQECTNFTWNGKTVGGLRREVIVVLPELHCIEYHGKPEDGPR